MFRPSRSPKSRTRGRLYLERYANSKYWVDFDDFSFTAWMCGCLLRGRLRSDGLGAGTDYDRAQPDPLADAAAGIIEHMNADHKDALVLLARRFAGIRVAGGCDDCRRSPRFSCAPEDAGRHAGRAHRVSAGSEQSDGSQEGLGRDGAAGAQV
jgi:hypothetical protein